MCIRDRAEDGTRGFGIGSDSDKFARGASASSGVRQTKNGTVYQRGNLVIADNAVDIDPESKDIEMKKIKRYSKAYFELVAANTKFENELLAEQRKDEEMIIRLRGVVYRIN